MSSEKKALLFVNKKKQKTSFTAGCDNLVPAPAGPKVFCFFFSKKEALACLS